MESTTRNRGHGGGYCDRTIVIIAETLRTMMYMINVASMDVEMKLINLISACYFIVPN